MSSTTLLFRFTAHPETLSRLVKQLGGKSAAPPSEIAGQLLIVAGDLLRRRDILQPDTSRIDAALQSLRLEEIEAWQRRPAQHDWTARLEGAAEQAIEAILPDAFDEAATWRQWAMEGLRTRDALQSAVAALSRIEAAGEVKQRLQTELLQHDRPLRVKARWWVALNDERRAERDALDFEGRSECWWFSARAECDDLIALLCGEKAQSAHVNSCAECQYDLANSRTVEWPRTRHLSGADLWKYDLNQATAAERTFVDLHARRCTACSQALSALSLDEEPLPHTPTVNSAPLRVLRPPDLEILDEHADFRLVLQRRRHEVRLLIQIHRPGRVAAAAVFLPSAPQRGLIPVQIAEGLEFKLGSETDVRGLQATLKVDLIGQAQYERAVLL